MEYPDTTQVKLLGSRQEKIIVDFRVEKTDPDLELDPAAEFKGLYCKLAAEVQKQKQISGFEIIDNLGSPTLYLGGGEKDTFYEPCVMNSFDDIVCTQFEANPEYYKIYREGFFLNFSTAPEEDRKCFPETQYNPKPQATTPAHLQDLRRLRLPRPKRLHLQASHGRRELRSLREALERLQVLPLRKVRQKQQVHGGDTTDRPLPLLRLVPEVRPVCDWLFPRGRVLLQRRPSGVSRLRDQECLQRV